MPASDLPSPAAARPSADGQVLNRGVQNPNALSDTQKARVGITTNTSDFASYNTGAGPATHGSSTLRVQLHQPTGLVKVAGHEVTPEVAETMQRTSPELFVEPEAAAAGPPRLPLKLTRPAQRRSPARTSIATQGRSKDTISIWLGKCPHNT